MSEKVENALTRLETIKKDLDKISKSFEENISAFTSTLSSGYEEIKSTGENIFQEGEKKIEEDTKEIQENLKKLEQEQKLELEQKLEAVKTTIITEMDRNQFNQKFEEITGQFNAILNEEKDGLIFFDENVAKMKSESQGMIQEASEKFGESLTAQNQINDQLHQKIAGLLQNVNETSTELLQNHEEGISTQLTQKYSELSTNFTKTQENLINELEAQSVQFSEMLEGQKNASNTLILESINMLMQQADSIKELLQNLLENERSQFSTSIETTKADSSQAFESHKETYNEVIAGVESLLSDILETKVDEVKTQLETGMMKKAFELMSLQEEQFARRKEELELAFSEKLVKSLENIEGTIEVTQDQMQTGIKDILTRIEELIHDQNKQMRDSFLENITTIADVVESYEGDFITIVDNTLLAHKNNVETIKAETEEFLMKAMEDFKLKMNELKENTL
ncbi:MAG: hypothetical protein ACW963_10680, partial [Candidatus Sifarchaeia archaeon]